MPSVRSARISASIMYSMGLNSWASNARTENFVMGIMSWEFVSTGISGVAILCFAR